MLEIGEIRHPPGHPNRPHAVTDVYEDEGLCELHTGDWGGRAYVVNQISKVEQWEIANANHH